MDYIIPNTVQQSFSYYNLILRKLWEKLPEKRAKILSEDIGSYLCPPGHPIILL